MMEWEEGKWQTFGPAAKEKSVAVYLCPLATEETVCTMDIWRGEKEGARCESKRGGRKAGDNSQA